MQPHKPNTRHRPRPPQPQPKTQLVRLLKEVDQNQNKRLLHKLTTIEP
jgi:hypothetical protein